MFHRVMFAFDFKCWIGDCVRVCALPSICGLVPVSLAPSLCGIVNRECSYNMEITVCTQRQLNSTRIHTIPRKLWVCVCVCVLCMSPWTCVCMCGMCAQCGNMHTCHLRRSLFRWHGFSSIYLIWKLCVCVFFLSTVFRRPALSIITHSIWQFCPI